MRSIDPIRRFPCRVRGRVRFSGPVTRLPSLIPSLLFAATILLAINIASAAEPATQPSPIAAYQGGGALLGQAEALPLPAAAPIKRPPLRVRWTYKTNDTERAGIEGGPSIAAGIVYVGDDKGTLHAIDLATGKPKWKYTAEDGFATTPLVMGGRIFLGDLAGIFHAISAEDGKKLWTIDTQSPIHSSANAVNGDILFANDGADLYCVAAADGKTVWKGAGGDRINAAPSIGGGLAYFSGCDAQLRGIELTKGDEKFATDLGALAPGSPVLLSDRIIVGTDQGHVVCYTPDGKEKLWSYDDVAEQAMVYATPAVADGIAVVGARDRQVHAIDVKTGKGLWTFKTRGDVDAPATIAGGRVYVPSKDKKLYVLDLKTGESIWEFTAARSIEAPVAIGNGVLVFGDSSGTVYCLEPTP